MYIQICLIELCWDWLSCLVAADGWLYYSGDRYSDARLLHPRHAGCLVQVPLSGGLSSEQTVPLNLSYTHTQWLCYTVKNWYVVWMLKTWIIMLHEDNGELNRLDNRGRGIITNSSNLFFSLYTLQPTSNLMHLDPFRLFLKLCSLALYWKHFVLDPSVFLFSRFLAK